MWLFFIHTLRGHSSLVPIPINFKILITKRLVINYSNNIMSIYATVNYVLLKYNIHNLQKNLNLNKSVLRF